MGVYIKNGSGDIKKLAGYVTVRQNARWFLCTRTIEDNVEYYTIPKEAETYFKSINAYTIYSFGFNESNTTNTPKLRYGTTVLDIKDFSNQAGEVMVGQLNGVFQMFTQDLATDPKIYFVANTHKDEYDTEMSDTSTNAVQNKVIKAYVDNAETLAEAIRDNTTQIIGYRARDIYGSFRASNAKPASSTYHRSGGIAVGLNAEAMEHSIALGDGAIAKNNASEYDVIAIGYNAKVNGQTGGIAIGTRAEAFNSSVALGTEAKVSGKDISTGYTVNTSIQLGKGTNSTSNSLQIYNDNIYKANTHTLTVKNAQVNGNNVYGVLQGETDPTGTTVGAVGQFYLNTASKALWQCVTITTTDATTYTWQPVGGSRKYQHNITINHAVFDGGTITSFRQICFSLINEQNSAMNYANIATYLRSLVTSRSNYINASGGHYNTTTSSFESLYFGVMSGNGTQIQMIKNAFSSNQFDFDTMNTSAVVNDTIIEL